MLLYRNHTRFPAIVTVKVDAVDELKPALKIGADEVFEEVKAAAGHHDVLVGPGKELHTLNNVQGIFVAARSAP